MDAIHSRSFDGWTEEESAPLLDYLCSVVESEEFQCRFGCAPAAVPSLQLSCGSCRQPTRVPPA